MLDSNDSAPAPLKLDPAGSSLRMRARAVADRSAVASPPAHSRTAARRMPGQRIAAVDAARGCAMILVCLSHIKHHFPETSPGLYWYLASATRIATPTFLLLSGFVIGHLLRTDSSGRAGLSLVDRGLFLIIVAHALLGIADLPQQAGFAAWVFGRAEITDVIGIALFVAVLLRAARASALLALGAALCLVSWVIGMTLTPQSGWATLLGSVLFHLRAASSPTIEAPLVAYLGVFLIGMALSVYVGRALLARQDRAVARHLLITGAAALAVVGVGIMGWHFGKGHLPDALREPDTMELLRATFDPRTKWPPGPAYLLFYGGSALLLTSFLFYGRPAWLTTPAIRMTSVIGRASLMCYVVQELLLFAVPDAFGFATLTSVPFWFAYFAAVVLLLYWLATQWDEARGNRFLTVGLKRMSRVRLERARRQGVQ